MWECRVLRNWYESENQLCQKFSVMRWISGAFRQPPFYGVFFSEFASGSAAMLVRRDRISASAEAEATYRQSTFPITAAVPIPAIAAWAIVLAARIPAHFHHFVFFRLLIIVIDRNSLLFLYCMIAGRIKCKWKHKEKTGLYLYIS